MTTTEKPKQERSIETRDKILQAGYQLILNKGYYHTNTAEIAQAAGVSSGIVYRYFKDKKDIFLQALKVLMADTLGNQVIVQLERIKSKEELITLLPTILQQFIEMHNFDIRKVNEMNALTLLDDDVWELFFSWRSQVGEVIEKTLNRLGYTSVHNREKGFMFFQLVEHLCDDSVLAKHLGLDFDFIFQHALEQCIDLLECDESEHTF